MSKSESKFQHELAKNYPDAYIKKIPDFKQSSSPALKGMPDYLFIRQSHFEWFEVKYVKSLKTFNFHEINEYQWIEFNKLLKAGSDVIVVIYNGKYDKFTAKFSDILRLRELGHKHFSL